MAYIPKEKPGAEPNIEEKPVKERKMRAKEAAPARLLSTICAVMVFLTVVSIGFGIYQYVASMQRSAVVNQATTNVVVATADIEQGEEISAGKVAVKAVPNSAVPENALTTTEGVVGRAAASYIPKNTALTGKSVAGVDAATLAGRVASGKVAVTVAVTQQGGDAGLIHQGDLVTVLGTAVGTGDASATELASSARVIALGSSMDAHTSEYATVTLEVTREDARKIATAQGSGNITLALESQNR